MSPVSRTVPAARAERALAAFATLLLLAACASPSRPPIDESNPTAEAAKNVVTVPPISAEVVPPALETAGATPPSEAAAEPPGEDSVYFALGSIDLGAAERKRLERVAGELVRDRSKKATLVGFTDHLGSREYSVALATKRINLISDTLVAAGVKPKQLKRLIRGYDTQSMRRCTTEICRQTLRRVDIQLTSGSKK